MEASLHEGYFLRGAICKGRLFHDETAVFGEALVKAHGLESQIVNFPRIMLTREVVSDARSSDRAKEFDKLIKQADDGPSYLHVLSLTLANSEQAHRPRGMRNIGSLSTIS
jgi:hypothetical protein